MLKVLLSTRSAKLVAWELPWGLMGAVGYIPQPYDQTFVPGLLNTLVNLESWDYTNVIGVVKYFNVGGKTLGLCFRLDFVTLAEYFGSFLVVDPDHVGGHRHFRFAVACRRINTFIFFLR